MRRRTKRRRRWGMVGKPSAVREVVGRLGGVRKAAVAGDCTTQAIYAALERGRFIHAAPVILLAKTLHPEDSAAQMTLASRLAGLSD